MESNCGITSLVWGDKDDIICNAYTVPNPSKQKVGAPVTKEPFSSITQHSIERERADLNKATPTY